MSFLPLTEKARRLGACLALVLFSAAAGSVSAQSLDIPSKKWGLSFGNSKEFTGLRFNFRDHGVVRITGVNVTLWTPLMRPAPGTNPKDSPVTGIEASSESRPDFWAWGPAKTSPASISAAWGWAPAAASRGTPP